MSRKRPKSLETDVYRKLWLFEHWAYINICKLKKTYRYSLVEEFRQHVTFAKNSYIAGYELYARFRDEKLRFFTAAIGELSIVESNMEHMVTPDLNIMSEKMWADAAIQIDNIRIELKKLINSLNIKSSGGSEPLNFGTAGGSSGHKDA